MKILKVLTAVFAMAVGITSVPAAASSAEYKVKLDQDHFPDAGFRKYISSNFDKDKDGSLDSKEISNIDVIYLTGSEVKDVRGIEYLSSLTHLFIYKSEISNVDVTRNPGLEKLTVRSNKIKSLDLSKNKKLTELDVYGSESLASLDISLCPKIKKFWFSAGLLKNLTLVSGQSFESTPYGGDPNPTWESSDAAVAKPRDDAAPNSFGKPGSKLFLKAKKAGTAVITEKWSWGNRTVNVRVLYKDVTDRSKFWFDPVYAMSDKDIIQGYDKGTRFRPGYQCTRAQMVTFLWRLEGCPKMKKAKNKFSDVKKSDYFYDAVLWGTGKKIVEGYSDGTFKPQRMCARRHAVTFLWKLAGKPEPKSTVNRFKDIKTGDFYYKAALWATENGIVAGYDDGTFRPNGICLRRQLATFLYKFDRNIRGNS